MSACLDIYIGLYIAAAGGKLNAPLEPQRVMGGRCVGGFIARCANASVCVLRVFLLLLICQVLVIIVCTVSHCGLLFESGPG